MRIIHLIAINNSILTDNFLKHLRETDDISNHTVCRLQNQNRKSDAVLQHIESDGLTGIIYTMNMFRLSDSIKFLRFLNTYDKIILHSQFLTVILQSIFMLYPCLIKKVYWISWGWDLYQWDAECKNSLRGIVKKLVNFRFRKKVGGFIGVFPPDVEYYKKVFKSNAKALFAPYGLAPTFCTESLNNVGENTNSNIINIQIGHSASRLLKHKEMLDLLYIFRDENIHISIPMTYGDMNYADEIEKYAKSLFGNKITVMRTGLRPDEYTMYLATVDVAVFNADRQLALGNIYQLLDMNKKVYLSSGSIMSGFFKSLDIPIGDIENISNIPFYDFYKPVISRTVKYNSFRELCTKHYSELWKRVYYG